MVRSMKTLTPQEAAGELNVTTETLRRWRVADIGPPFVMQGANRPRYRADLLKPGDYTVGGRQDRFPPPKLEVIDGSGLSAPERAMLDALLSKCDTSVFEPGDSLALVSPHGALDASDPVVAALMRELISQATSQDG